jgi:hypothetical protein
MSAVRWNTTLVDAPGFDPYAVVGDLVVAVRTPRSRDFVTVEVAPAMQCGNDLPLPGSVVLSPKPAPFLTDQWQGEVHIGTTVRFRVAGESYQLTLARLAESPPGSPWITCDLCLERG